MFTAGPVRGYAAEAGGKYERKLPHMNIGYVLAAAVRLDDCMTSC